MTTNASPSSPKRKFDGVDDTIDRPSKLQYKKSSPPQEAPKCVTPPPRTPVIQQKSLTPPRIVPTTPPATQNDVLNQVVALGCSINESEKKINVLVDKVSKYRTMDTCLVKNYHQVLETKQKMEELGAEGLEIAEVIESTVTVLSLLSKAMENARKQKTKDSNNHLILYSEMNQKKAKMAQCMIDYTSSHKLV